MGFSRKMIVVLSAAILCVGFVVLLAFMINILANKIQVLRQNSAMNSDAITRLAGLETDYRKVQGDFINMQNVLPTRDQLFVLPDKLKVLAKGFQLGADWSFGAISSAQNDLPPAASFTAVFNGKLSDLLRYLETLEHLRYFFSFRQTNITSNTNIINDTVTVRITGSLYIKQ